MNAGSINDNKENNELIIAEYSAIKTELSTLFQKVGILLAVTILLVGMFIGLSIFLTDRFNNNNYLCLLILNIPSFISIILTLLVLIPNLNKSDDSKYFADFSNMSEENIKSSIKSQNMIKQIKKNSQILHKKYTFYKWSIFATFFPIALFLLIFFINRDFKNKIS